MGKGYSKPPPPPGSGGDVVDWGVERARRGLPVAKPPPPEPVNPNAVVGARLLVPDRYIGCKHEQVIVDDERAVVTCSAAACGEQVDPVWVLMRYALKERQLVAGDEMRKNEQARLHKEIEALKRTKANMQSGVRKGRDPAIVAERDDYKRLYEHLRNQVGKLYDEKKKLAAQVRKLGATPCIADPVTIIHQD